MSNLFKYAKKELSQDAFLMWVVSNYDSKSSTLRKVAIQFIGFLMGDGSVIDPDDIKKITIEPQWMKIDVVINITTKNGDITSIYIEDKVFSNEHNQLCKYNESIKKERENRNNIKVFYKTDYIDEDEREHVKKAGWRIVDIEEIQSFWEQFIACDDEIVAMYAERVNDIALALKNEELPVAYCDDRAIEMLKWKGFFANYIFPNLDDEVKECCDLEMLRTSYSYIAFVIRKRGYEYPIPYLEIRDRDCTNGHYKCLLLTYGMAGKNERCKDWDDIREINTRINDSSFFAVNNRTKQVLATKKNSVKRREDFLARLNRCAKDYIEIINALYK